MNIVFFSNLYFPNIGGVETAVSRFARLLFKNGISINIITSRFPHELSKEEAVDGINVLRLPFRLPTLKPFYSIFMFIFRFLECIAGILSYNRENKIDLVNLHFPTENSIYAIFLSWISKVPLVTSIHGGEIESFAHSNRIKWWILDFTLKKSSYIVTNSHDLYQKVRSTFPGIPDYKYKVIGNCVEIPGDVQDSTFSPDSDSFIIGIGRFDYIKGFDLLIQSFKILNDLFPESKLLIVGDGIERNNLMQLSESLLLQNNVIFTGAVTNSIVFKYIANSSFLVLPSRQEAFGIVCLESMIMGKPVVAFDVGGVSEIIIENYNGLLVKQHTAEALAEKIIQLYNAPSLIDVLGQNGKKYVQSNFSSEMIYSKYMDVYNKCFKVSRYSEFSRYNNW